MLQTLLELLDRTHPVLIQTHDFPDHDAIGSGHALHWILTQRGFCTFLCYNGEFQSETLKVTIDELKIPLIAAKDLHLKETNQIVLVDGFAGNTNVTDIMGELVGIIDHHTPPIPASCPFIDIRTSYGSCSTILYTYLKEHGGPIPRSIATSLLMGIMTDTAFMTRAVSPMDLEAFSTLFFQGDWQRASYILKNCLALQDLPIIQQAVNHYRIIDEICFLELDLECTSELLGLVSDFFLGLKEIIIVVSWAFEKDILHVSVRSEDPARPADLIVRRALAGIGSGGGHVHMGGGAITRNRFPGAEVLRSRFLEALGKKEHP
ncbi:MAG: DHH family phosphoesterase [Spirochaetes bacterium]|nr:DHH family phosphoesterase [Spirochaetota bacterium]